MFWRQPFPSFRKELRIVLPGVCPLASFKAPLFNPVILIPSNTSFAVTVCVAVRVFDPLAPVVAKAAVPEPPPA